MPFPYCVLGEQGRADPVDQTSDLLVTRNITVPYIKFGSFQGVFQGDGGWVHNALKSTENRKGGFGSYPPKIHHQDN